jgi:hypothetical protein
MAKRIHVLPEIKAQVSDGNDFEGYCCWDITVQSDIHLPTFRRKLMFSSTGRIMERAGSAKTSLNLYDMTRRHVAEGNILQRIF